MIDEQIFKLAKYHYNLPNHLVARYPLVDRDASKLLVVDGQDAGVQHCIFSQLTEFLQPGDLIVFNDTKVIKSRLFGLKETGGRVEVFVVQTAGNEGTAFIKASKAPKPGSLIRIPVDASCDEVVEVGAQQLDGTYAVRYERAWLDLFLRAGHMPLPPYMDRSAEQSDDERYQTVWASKPGAVAAPTASLHFTQDVLDQLQSKGVRQARLTLHVGAGTFSPVRVDDIREHQMHSEYYDVDQSVITALQETKQAGGRIVAVGTTVLRTLETLAQHKSVMQLSPESGETSIFIYPGFEFKLVDLLVTNFHLPESTLLMLVSAFAGKERIDNAYKTAIEHEYRFFSYGDAMLLTREEREVKKKEVGHEIYSS